MVADKGIDIVAIDAQVIGKFYNTAVNFGNDEAEQDSNQCNQQAKAQQKLSQI